MLRSPEGTEGAGLTGCCNFLRTKYKLLSHSCLLIASANHTLFHLKRKQFTSTTPENPQYLLQMVNLVNLETEQKLKACCKVSALGAEPGASKLVVRRKIRNKGDLKKKTKTKNLPRMRRAQRSIWKDARKANIHSFAPKGSET